MARIFIHGIIISLCIVFNFYGCKPEKKSVSIYNNVELESDIQQAVQKAGKWFVSFPQSQLNFDAAIGMHFITKLSVNKDYNNAYRIARENADKDYDNPQRRFWVPDCKTKEHYVNGWTIPKDDDVRASINNVISEALYCADFDIRRETLEYIQGPMRDNGGYYSTHALWALVIAYQNGCLSGNEFERYADILVEELYDAQRKHKMQKTTISVDLYAERLLMILMAAQIQPQFMKPQEMNSYLKKILELQNTDGSWGYESKIPYMNYHATMIAVWTLLVWKKFMG